MQSNEIRITSGTLRGRRLRTLPGLATRPTRAFVREALFDILGDRVDGSNVLDLFAGSGALGLEALSRGAAHATFVESHRRAFALLSEQVRSLVEPERQHCWCGDAFALGVAQLPRQPIEIVFLDPPYALWQEPALSQRLFENLTGWQRAGALGADALLVVETEEPARLRHAPWVPADLRRYGRTCLLFLRAPPGTD